MNNYRQHNLIVTHPALWFAAMVLVATNGPVWSATSTTPEATNATRVATSAPAPRYARPTFNSFSNITLVNIFNAWRTQSGNNAGEDAKRPRPPSLERFALTGTISYTKAGTLAFFDGTSPEYKKVLKNEATIGKFKITEITHSGVKLEVGDQKYELKVGMQMSRPPGGEWSVSVRTDSFFASTDSSASADSGDFNPRMNRDQSMGFDRNSFRGDNGGGNGRRQPRGGRGGFGGGDSGGGPGSFSAPVTPSAPTSSSSDPSVKAETDDILKKLMEAREKETQ